MSFNRSEFACKCGCGFDIVDYELMAVLVDLRKLLDSPIYINSGCRCEAHNKAVGGDVDSTHKLGRAADIRNKKTDASSVYELLNALYPNKYGIGLYDGRVHIDVRIERARWNKQENKDAT